MKIQNSAYKKLWVQKYLQKQKPHFIKMLFYLSNYCYVYWMLMLFFINIDKMSFFPLVKEYFTDRIYSLDVLVTLSEIWSPVPWIIKTK